MTLSALKRKYFGDRAFYRMVLTVAVPIMIQNGITNFVGLLDNVMVGQVGTAPMSGVSIVNQLLFVYNLCIFGGLSGAGIFTAQYFGHGDTDGIRHTFRYKLWLGVLLTAAAAILLFLRGDQLIELYLRGEAGQGDPAEVLRYGQEYLRLMLIGLPPFMLVQSYTSTLRECGETMLPMKAGIAAVFVNLFFNWVLIFGQLGCPAMGVAGAAVATVISRFVELAIVVIWTHTHTGKCAWAKGLYNTIRIPRRLIRPFLLKGTPLLVNEALWSSAQAVLTQCYTVRSLSSVAALNISSTIGNLFSIIFLTMGSAVAIIIGQLLGAGRMEEAKSTDTRLIVFSVLCASATAAILWLAAPLFPHLYNTEAEVRELAVRFMRVNALFMPMHAFLNSCYFTLRAGGRTIVTFLFDSVCAWVISIPIAWCLSRFTGMDAVLIIVMVNLGDLIKCAVGYILVKKDIWLVNMIRS